jgi:hypothetical protein
VLFLRQTIVLSPVSLHNPACSSRTVRLHLQAVAEGTGPEPAAFRASSLPVAKPSSRDARLSAALDFQLEFQEGSSLMRGESPNSVVKELVTSFPPVAATYEGLDGARQAEMRGALEDCFRRYQQPGGQVSLDRAYLLTIGTRRAA